MGISARSRRDRPGRGQRIGCWMGRDKGWMAMEELIQENKGKANEKERGRRLSRARRGTRRGFCFLLDRRASGEADEGRN